MLIAENLAAVRIQCGREGDSEPTVETCGDAPPPACDGDSDEDCTCVLPAGERGYKPEAVPKGTAPCGTIPAADEASYEPIREVEVEVCVRPAEAGTLSERDWAPGRDWTAIGCVSGGGDWSLIRTPIGRR